VLQSATSDKAFMIVGTHSRHTKNKSKLKKKNAFDAGDFLDSTTLTRKIAEYSEKQRTYPHGDPSTSVLYIQRGGAKLSIVNPAGKEVVVAIFDLGDCFGDSGLAGQSVCTTTATAMTPTSHFVIEMNELIRVLHADHNCSYRYLSFILSRNIRIEEDLVEQLLNSSEKGWPALFCCSQAMAAKAHPKSYPSRCPKRFWRK
jgi:CRP/FNR family cyclic AMP-dependent transcriptional regulator